MNTKQILILTLLLFLAVGGASGKKKSPVQKIYIFGLAASFSDTIVHFTPIEEVDSAWLDNKKFLMAREEYSYQLRDYLAAKLLMPQRTCMVFFDKNRKKLEKKFASMMRLYTTVPKKGRGYDVRHIGQQDFHFRAVDMSGLVEQQNAKAATEATKASKKKRKGKLTDQKGVAKPGDGPDGRGERRSSRGQ